MWLIRLDAHLPGSMDPEVRADLLDRFRTLISGWPAQVWQVPGGWRLVALLDSDDPHSLIAELPLHPWLRVTVEPLVGYPE